MWLIIITVIRHTIVELKKEKSNISLSFSPKYAIFLLGQTNSIFD